MLVTLLGSCNGAAVLEHAAKARQLATTLQAEFASAVEASNRAVLADSEPASGDSAREAEGARERVKSSERRLDALLLELHYSDERKLLDEFRAKFAAYEVLDGKILELAAEKSNVKATQLAFGPARDAADAFKQALSKLPSNGNERTRSLVQEAVLAVRELQTLEPPHIAEPKDIAMTRLEEDMTSLDTTARAALGQLTSVVGAAELQVAMAALDRFTKLNAEIVALSRRNTNVHSLELTLGQKRTVVATCDESLRAVRAALVERANRPTR